MEEGWRKERERGRRERVESGEKEGRQNLNL
jgi:hypothetical protein